VSGLGTEDEVSGVTSAAGEFTYVPSANVAFSIGGIQLGYAPSAFRLSPLHLAAASGDPYITPINLARFLQTIDDDDNLTNGIEVTEAVRAAAAGHWIDFGMPTYLFDTDSTVVAIVAALTSVTQAGERALIPDSTAQRNLESGIRAGYQGTYRGTYCRYNDTGLERGGSWTMRVGPNAEVSMTFIGTPGFTVRGSMSLGGSIDIWVTNAIVRGGFYPTFRGTWEWMGEVGGVFYTEATNCGNVP